MYDRLVQVVLSLDAFNSRLSARYSLQLRGLANPNFPHTPNLNPLYQLFETQLLFYVTDVTMSTVLYKSSPDMQLRALPLLYTLPSKQL